MARPAIDKEQKKREGAQLKEAYERASEETGITQEEVIAKLGLKSQGQFGQWCSGGTAIPDKTLLKLGKMLNFNAVSVRPSLAEYAEYFDTDPLLEGLSSEQKATIKAVVHAFAQSKHGKNGNTGTDRN